MIGTTFVVKRDDDGHYLAADQTEGGWTDDLGEAMRFVTFDDADSAAIEEASTSTNVRVVPVRAKKRMLVRLTEQELADRLADERFDALMLERQAVLAAMRRRLAAARLEARRCETPSQARAVIEMAFASTIAEIDMTEHRKAG